MSSRMVMLGLDSIDWLLVNQWAGDGGLPVLRGLLEQGRRLQFGPSNRPLPGSIWTDIATGTSAAIHRFVHEEQVPLGSYRTERVDASRVNSPPFYKALSDAGVSCAVVDYPVDFPLQDFRGIQVVDWGTEFKLWRYETRPHGFAASLKARYGDHPLTNYPGTRATPSELTALNARLKRGVELKRRLTLDLLREGEHDFVFVNFAELHKAGHFFWCFHDTTHPEYTTAHPELNGALRELYEQLDAALGSVLAQLRDDDDLVLVTDRGMYADHRGDHLVDALLARLGLATPRGRGGDGADLQPTWRARLLQRRAAYAAFRFVGQKLLPNAVREALLPYHRAAVGGAAPMDWTKTQVFRLPSVGNSYLRLNVGGREPLGMVSPGEEYAALLACLSERFMALVNAETGEAAVESVHFPARDFAGPYAAELPDVAIVWNARHALNRIWSPQIGELGGRQESDRTGNHRPEGFALFTGNSYASGGRSAVADARQVAPAVLRRYGLAPPPHYEMTVPSVLRD